MAKSIYEIATGKESPRTRRAEAAARKTGSRIADDVRADPGVQAGARAGVRAATGVRNQMRDRKKVRRVRTSMPPEQKRQLQQGAGVGGAAATAGVLGGQAVQEGVRATQTTRGAINAAQLSRAKKAGRTVRVVAAKAPRGKAGVAAAAAGGAAILGRRATTTDRPYRDWYDGR